jgi:hypothetical protein
VKSCAEGINYVYDTDIPVRGRTMFIKIAGALIALALQTKSA